VTRKAELTGIVRPEIDSAAAERETSRLSELMDSAAHLSPTLDTSGFRRKFERAIPSGETFTAGLDSLTGRGGPTMDQPAGGGGPGLADQSIQAAQLEKLEDIHDEIEKSAVSGDGGGGGGIVSAAAGSLAARGLLSGLAAGGTAATAATLTGAGLVGGGLGLAGVAGLDQTGLFEGLRGAGQDVGSELGSDTTTSLLRGANTLSLGTLGGFSRLGAGALGTVRGEKGLGAESRKQVDQTFGNSSPIRALLDWEWPEYPALDNLSWPDPPELEIPDSLNDLSLETPDWMSNSDTLDFEVPNWLDQSEGLSLDNPGWLGEDGNLGFDTPDWLSDDGGLGISRPGWLDEGGNLGMSVADWLVRDGDLGLSAPDWLDGEGDLEISTPDWLNGEGDLGISTPSWLENGAIDINVPEELEQLGEQMPGSGGNDGILDGMVSETNGYLTSHSGQTGGQNGRDFSQTGDQDNGVNTQINVTQKFEFSEREIRREMQQAFEQNRRQIVDEAVRQIESQLPSGPLG